MSINEQIQKDVTTAAKDTSEEGKKKLMVLRMLRAAIKNEEIRLSVREKGLDDDQIISLIRKEVKRRKEAAETYRNHNEEERAKNELNEAEMLSSYTPSLASEEDIRRVVEEIIKKIPENKRSIGNIMKEAMPAFKGNADGRTVKRVVEDLVKT